MPKKGRNAEVIRQWGLLLHLDVHRNGVDVYDLASRFEVTRRTIWRDIAALQAVGFPLRDEKRDKKTYWMLTREPLKALANAGLSWTEVCSLYVSKAFVLGMAGAPFAASVQSAFKKIEKALSPQMKQFLEDLPGVVRVKPAALKRAEVKDYPEIVARVIDACSTRRIARMQYFSAGKSREKEYEIHPYQVAYHDGGLYLSAYVPEYRGLRTFALERIRKFTVLQRPFTPQADVASDAFGNSLGVNQGAPERIVIDFGPRVAQYVRERTWHDSQKLSVLPDGGVRCTLKVCRDYALEHWILGWGPHARVVSPSALAEQVLERITEAREAYVPKLQFDAPAMLRISPPARLPLRIT